MSAQLQSLGGFRVSERHLKLSVNMRRPVAPPKEACHVWCEKNTTSATAPAASPLAKTIRCASGRRAPPGEDSTANAGISSGARPNVFRSEVFYSPIAASSTVNGRVIGFDYTHYGL